MAATSDSGEPLCLLSVHAHPDDEASKGAGTVLRYNSEGVRNVLVTCTGGEEGDIINEEMRRPEVEADLVAIREAELAESVRILRFDHLHLLGYRDSGMPDSEGNTRPDNFANADFEEAVGRLVAVIREQRPQVIITYAEEQSRYPHPDHLQVHAISGPAFERAGDPTHYPEAGRPWSPSKLYYTHGMSRARIHSQHAWFEARGEKSPFADWVSGIPEDADNAVTTRIHVGPHIETARAALLAHRTQVAPTFGWFRMPVDVMATVHPWEEYQLAATRVGRGQPDESGFETDLFAGLR